MIVRNPMRDAITIEIDRRGCKYLTLEYARSPVPSGLTVNIMVDCYIKNPGEYAGSLRIKWRLYKVEVAARKRPNRASADVDAGHFTVPVFVTALDSKSFGSESAECSYPVTEFQKACAQPCPRYYLALIIQSIDTKNRSQQECGKGQRVSLQQEDKLVTGKQLLPRPGSKQMERMKHFC